MIAPEAHGDLKDQLPRAVVLVRGSHQIEFRTGRHDTRTGRPEVLLRAIGTSDRDAMRRCAAFLEHAIAERAKS